MKSENFEYKTIIEFNRSVDIDEMKKIVEVVNKAFDNRAGKVQNLSNDPYILIYAGNENLYGCLQLGILSMRKLELIINEVENWNWIDSEPTESCNLLEVFKRHERNLNGRKQKANNI